MAVLILEKLYAQFGNDSVGSRKFFLSESDEVTKSNVCIREIRQRSGFECSLAAAAHISNRSVRETAVSISVKGTVKTSAMPSVTPNPVDIFATEIKELDVLRVHKNV